MERHPIVRAGKAFCRTLTTLYHDLKVLAPCEIPLESGGILVSNHTSSLDPILLQASCPRLITWMMAKEYYPLFGLKWFFDIIDPILVERSGRDMSATRMALRALKEGRLIGLFPEGRIEHDGVMLEFQTGVALLASRAGVPVYPAYLDGSQRRKEMIESLLTPHYCSVAYGPPVIVGEVDGREGLDAATQRIRDAVKDLGRFSA